MSKLDDKKTTYIIAGTIAGIGCIVMVVFPAIALNSAQKGVSLWASSVLPALLPFFICANFMTALGLPVIIGRFFEEPFRKIFGAPGSSAFVFSISITSGYPMGAKLIGDMGRLNEITKDDAKRMLTFCSTSGPLFMLGAVGVGMLNSAAAGAVIAIAHYLGAILNGVLFRIFSSFHTKSYVKYSKRHHFTHVPECFGKDSLLDIFTDSIISSFRALGIICGYIVLFTLITDFIQFSGVLNYLENSYSKGLFKGLFEMTVGCNTVARTVDSTLVLKCILCSFIISWGGLSVLAQSMSMLAGLNISVLFYTFTKLTHGILAGIIAWIIAPYVLSMEVTSVGGFGQAELINGLGFIYGLLFSTKMVIMIVVMFGITILIDKVIRRINERIRDNSRI